MAARRAAEAAGRDGNKAAQAVSSTGITLQEAQQILNLKDIDDVETIRKVCVCVRVCERERESVCVRERERVCVCLCVREKGGSVPTVH